MKKIRWLKSEVISFLEEKIKDETVDEDEMEMYEDYKWNGNLDKNKYINTYKNLLREMKKYYDGK